MIKRIDVDFLSGNIIRSLIIFAIPVFISSIFQQLYNTTDTIIVGHVLGENSLAAIGACSSVYDLLVGFALGVGNGMSIVIARIYGSKKYDLLKKSVAGAIIIGIILCIIITLFSELFLYDFLKLLNTPYNIIDEAYDYIALITLFVFVMFAYNICAGIMKSIGNSIIPLIFLIVSSVTNIILDIVFIVYLNMGVKGAAIGTVLAQAFSSLLCILYIKKHYDILIPTPEDFNIDINLYKELLGQGFSMGLMMSIVSIGTVILQTSINSLGSTVIAGHTAARKISTFACMPCSTIASSLSVFVSQNNGAGLQERIYKGVKYGNIIVIIWSLIITIIMFLFARNFIKIISGSTNPIILENGTNYLIINAPFYSILGILLNLRSSLQGLGRKIVPLISSVIECIGKILFVVFLISYLGYFGIIICEPIIWCIMCIQLAYAFYKNKKNHKHLEL